jgi:uncharacterized protein YecT (DUF1311 family)
MASTVLVLLLLLVAGPAMAQPAGCKDGTQIELNDCTSRQATAAEAEMNEVLRVIDGKLDAAGRARLAAAQRAWAAYREQECLFRTGGGTEAGGTIAPELLNECARNVTRERIASLRAQLKCPGGDLSCPP